MAFKTKKEKRHLIEQGLRWCCKCDQVFPDTTEYFYQRPSGQGKGRHKPCAIKEAAINQKVRRGNAPKTTRQIKERVVSKTHTGPKKGSVEHMFFMRAAK